MTVRCWFCGELQGNVTPVSLLAKDSVIQIVIEEYAVAWLDLQGATGQLRPRHSEGHFIRLGLDVVEPIELIIEGRAMRAGYHA